MVDVETISAWPCCEDFNDYHQNYNNRVSRPASQAVHEWLENLRTLRWVPQIVPGDMRNVEEWDDDRYEKDIAQHSASEQTRQSGEQVHVFGTSLRSGLPDNHASVPYPERRAAERNRVFAWRNMYKEAGWPERYDREAFEAKRKQYLEELAEVTDVYTRGPRAACYWDLEAGKLLREFYKRWAGADAV